LDRRVAVAVISPESGCHDATVVVVAHSNWLEVMLVEDVAQGRDVGFALADGGISNDRHVKHTVVSGHLSPHLCGIGDN